MFQERRRLLPGCNKYIHMTFRLMNYRLLITPLTSLPIKVHSNLSSSAMLAFLTLPSLVPFKATPWSTLASPWTSSWLSKKSFLDKSLFNTPSFSTRSAGTVAQYRGADRGRGREASRGTGRGAGGRSRGRGGVRGGGGNASASGGPSPGTGMDFYRPKLTIPPIDFANAQLPVRIETDNVPVVIFSSGDVEPDAVQQLVNLAQTKIPVGFVSAMPDVHLGKGATIGSVFASEKYISPNAVGVDIGCGMTAVPTDLFKEELTLPQKKEIQAKIKQRIPTGFNWHKRPLKGTNITLDTISDQNEPTKWLKDNILTDYKTPCQLGSLGGGNHFIEVVYDETDRIWLMLHSGSRAAGNNTAQYYDSLAQIECEKRGDKYPTGLAFLEVDSETGQRYLQDMLWSQAYAFQNRQFMLDNMMEAFCEVTGASPILEKRINAHHNFCQCETCTYTDPKTGQTYTKDLWVTRKGATSARMGQYGIIPGSMGTGSYIVKGKGNLDAWQSCSHGAGRKMSRAKAVRTIKQYDFEQAMKGIVCDTNHKVIDEAPAAYKDLESVMKDQEPLVDVVHRLLPLINVKGF